ALAAPLTGRALARALAAPTDEGALAARLQFALFVALEHDEAVALAFVRDALLHAAELGRANGRALLARVPRALLRAGEEPVTDTPRFGRSALGARVSAAAERAGLVLRPLAALTAERPSIVTLGHPVVADDARSAGTGSTARARPALRGVPSGAGVQKAEGTGGFLAGSALRGLAPCPRAVRAAHPSPAAAGRVGRLRRPAGPLVAPLPRRAMLVTNARHVGRGRVVDTEHG